MPGLRAALNFPGIAEEVLEYYKSIVGGDVQLFRFEGTPTEQYVPADYKKKILWGTLTCDFGELYVMDAPPGREGSAGTNFTLCLECEDETRAKTMFDGLASGGNLEMPWDAAFFAKKFGMATDKYGIPWMVNVPLDQPMTPAK